MHETPELKGRVTFSAPFTRDVAEIIMRNANAPPVRSDADLGGRTIHLRPTSKYASTMGSVNRRLRERGLPEATIIPLSEHLADADIIELMNAGLIEYTVLDQYRGDFWASVFPQVVAEHQHPLAEHLPLRFLLRNDTPRLKVLLDKFIASHGVGTEYGNTLVRRYFKTNPRARRAMGPAELDRFRTTVEIFRKYASKYGFDHLMLTAQGFQESGLNQSVRSAAGAVGVMQVMPSTGKAMRVGDIHKVEPNIHAGVKYMDRLASTYFNDPDLDELNRTLLCFAAYNAGPTRINSFRREATRRRLDPNRWFDHVERIAAERGLRETVQYVVNITKYSVAYRLLEEDAANREAAKRAVKTHAP
jgi:membrane-bound lytic murein transglycosylase MltF